MTTYTREWYQSVCFIFHYIYQFESCVIAFLEKSIIPGKGQNVSSFRVIERAIQAQWLRAMENMKYKYTACISNNDRIRVTYDLHSSLCKNYMNNHRFHT